MLEQPVGDMRSDPAKRTGIIDVDVHEMFHSEKDLVPYLDEPWRGRVAPIEGWKAPVLPYSWPLIGGVAMADSALGDGRPAGSSYETTREQLLDRYDIGCAMLTGLFYPTDMQVQPEFATALATAYNDWVLENWLEKDERFRGSVQVAAQDPHAAAREIDRVGAHPRVVQVILPAISHDVLARSFFHPVWEAAVRNDLVVAFHQSTGTQTAVGLPPYYIEWHTAISQAWQSQLIGVISHGLFDKLPDLRVVLLESSWTWVPHLMWRFDYNYRSLRREVPWVKRMPSEYIREHVRISTQPMEVADDPQQLFRMFEMIGTDEFLLFSTDYPHWDFDSPQAAFPPSFPRELREKILYENAASFYRLSSE